MANSLGLAGDGDELELVREVERAFDIRIESPEAEKLQTVGQLCDLIAGKIPVHDSDRKSALAMTYYRLARALRGLHDEKMTPETDLAFLEKQGVRKAFRALEAQSGFRLPSPAMTLAGTIGGVVAAVTFLAGCFLAGFYGRAQWAAVAWIVSALAGLAAVWLDAGKLPDDCTTLGALARQTTPLNFGHLAKLGASHRDKDIWHNLQELLSDYDLPKNQITRETFFLRNPIKAAVPS